VNLLRYPRKMPFRKRGTRFLVERSDKVGVNPWVRQVEKPLHAVRWDLLDERELVVGG